MLAGLVGPAALAGCSAPRACLRPGYAFEVREPEGGPASGARVSFQTVERAADGAVARTVAREVTLVADDGGKVVVGPLRGRAPGPSPGIERSTRIVVSMPDGRRIESFHPIAPRVRCEILEAAPIVLQAAAGDMAAAGKRSGEDAPDGDGGS